MEFHDFLSINYQIDIGIMPEESESVSYFYKKFYTILGNNHQESSWKSRLGRLNRVRFGQASISNGLEVMILGGTPRNNHRPEM